MEGLACFWWPGLVTCLDNCCEESDIINVLVINDQKLQYFNENYDDNDQLVRKADIGNPF